MVGWGKDMLNRWRIITLDEAKRHNLGNRSRQEEGHLKTDGHGKAAKTMGVLLQ